MARQIETVFDAPGPHPNGMQATAEGLWILDQSTNEASLVSWSGEKIRTLETSSDRGSGITCDGSILWLASTYSCEILKVDAATGKTIESYPTPGADKTGAHGLELRNGNLWMSVPPAAMIYEVNLETGFEVVRSFPAPGPRPHGIGWYKDDLWCVETGHRAIYRLDLEDGSVMEKIEVPEPIPEPHGMTIWNSVMWYCDAVTRTICRMEM
jgi:streptogramin lyase